MSRSTEFLLELARSLEQELTGLAAVDSRVDGSYCELKVTPIRAEACGFTIHSEEDTEMTVEFGRFSVAHVYSPDFDALAADLNSMVTALLAGEVHERVGFVNEKPCRAKATVGEGGATSAFSTRDGLCIGGETRKFEYSPYRS
ncbi:hypothetical protein [Paractinoplanes globisporus]|uniref:Uncharacterized protein n=1 Tax=Paractinoplanes globisporus TaxID=113565 RepID=A0ABW6WLR4_9ACTN|nr:hypothetical protein [Actinoplanes globisporus]